jgi:hypothetical protein
MKELKNKVNGNQADTSETHKSRFILQQCRGTNMKLDENKENLKKEKVCDLKAGALSVLSYPSNCFGEQRLNS